MLFLWSFQSWRIEILFVSHQDCFCPLFLVLLLPFRRDSCVCSLVSPDDSFGAIDVYLDKKRISWMQRSWKRFSRRTKISFGRKRDTIFFFYRSGSELVSNESSFTPLPKRHVRSSRLEIRNEAPSTTNRATDSIWFLFVRSGTCFSLARIARSLGRVFRILVSRVSLQDRGIEARGSSTCHRTSFRLLLALEREKRMESNDRIG